MKGIVNREPFRKSIPDVRPDIYLFPSFGRRKGFGEPDALVVIGDYTFWIEVETTVDLLKGMTRFEKALLQLFRFSFLAQAIREGCHTRKDAGPHHLAIEGVTIGNNLEPRSGVLKLAGHLVLDGVRNSVSRSVASKNDHYVLLLDRKALGITSDEVRNRFRESLTLCRRKMETSVQSNSKKRFFPELAEDRFWRLYWCGGLSETFDRAGLEDPFATPGGTVYVRTVSSTRK